MSKTKVLQGTRIFVSSFIDELKKAEKGLSKMSRIVAQNNSDEVATNIARKNPTIQISTQRLVMSLTASMNMLTPFTRYDTEAYLQSRSNLEELYKLSHKEMGFAPNTVLKVVKPLYCVPDSGHHWYFTYLDHHINTLRMKIAPTIRYFLTDTKR